MPKYTPYYTLAHGLKSTRTPVVNCAEKKNLKSISMPNVVLAYATCAGSKHLSAN